MAESNTIDTKTLGLTRWVQVAFMVTFVGLFWLLDKIVVLVWELFAEANTTVASVAAVAIASVTVWRLYKDERIVGWAHEVIGELSKVAWPSRKETTASTVVVIITSIIAAMILGAFDAVWSTITDLIYKA